MQKGKILGLDAREVFVKIAADEVEKNYDYLA
jgi:hypothetical protein